MILSHFYINIPIYMYLIRRCFTLLHHYKGGALKFIMKTNEYEGNLQIDELDKCEKLEWFCIDELPENYNFM